MGERTLVSYILANRNRNVEDTKIRSALEHEGWSMAEIDSAFATVADPRKLVDLGGMMEVGDLLATSWYHTIGRLRAYAILMVGAFLTVILFGVAIVGVHMLLEPHYILNEEWLIGVLVTVFVVVGLPLGGWVQFCLVRMMIEDDVPGLRNLIWPIDWRKAWGIVGLSIVSGIVVMGGLSLFIIPGIVLSLYLYFQQLIYVKEGVSVWQALSRSVYYTHGHFVELLVRISFLVGISLLSSVVFDFVRSLSVLLSGMMELTFSLVYGAFSISYTYHIYKDLMSMNKPGDFAPVPWFKPLVIGGVVWMLVLCGLVVTRIYTVSGLEGFRDVWSELGSEQQTNSEIISPLNEEVSSENDGVLGTSTSELDALMQMRSRLFGYYLKHGEFPKTLQQIGVDEDEFRYRLEDGTRFELCDLRDGVVLCIDD